MFESIVKQVVDSLPDEFKSKLDNVSVVVKDHPPSPHLLGLYQGIPQTQRKYYGIGGPLPDKITVFKIPIQNMARNRSELVQIIYDVVVHEIAHHFGMSEAEVRKAEQKRYNNVNINS